MPYFVNVSAKETTIHGLRRDGRPCMAKARERYGPFATLGEAITSSLKLSKWTKRVSACNRCKAIGHVRLAEEIAYAKRQRSS